MNIFRTRSRPTKLFAHGAHRLNRLLHVTIENVVLSLHGLTYLAVSILNKYIFIHIRHIVLEDDLQSISSQQSIAI